MGGHQNRFRRRTRQAFLKGLVVPWLAIFVAAMLVTMVVRWAVQDQTVGAVRIIYLAAAILGPFFLVGGLAGAMWPRQRAFGVGMALAGALAVPLTLGTLL